MSWTTIDNRSYTAGVVRISSTLPTSTLTANITHPPLTYRAEYRMDEWDRNLFILYVRVTSCSAPLVVEAGFELSQVELAQERQSIQRGQSDESDESTDESADAFFPFAFISAFATASQSVLFPGLFTFFSFLPVFWERIFPIFCWSSLMRSFNSFLSHLTSFSCSLRSTLSCSAVLRRKAF